MLRRFACSTSATHLSSRAGSNDRPDSAKLRSTSPPRRRPALSPASTVTAPRRVETAAPWLYGIAANLLRRYWGEQTIETRYRERLGVLDQTRFSGDTELDAIERLDATAVAERLQAALEALPAAYRDAVKLRVVDELSCTGRAADRMERQRGLPHECACIGGGGARAHAALRREETRDRLSGAHADRARARRRRGAPRRSAAATSPAQAPRRARGRTARIAGGRSGRRRRRRRGTARRSTARHLRLRRRSRAADLEFRRRGAQAGVPPSRSRRADGCSCRRPASST